MSKIYVLVNILVYIYLIYLASMWSFCMWESKLSTKLFKTKLQVYSWSQSKYIFRFYNFVINMFFYLFSVLQCLNSAVITKTSIHLLYIMKIQERMRKNSIILPILGTWEPIINFSSSEFKLTVHLKKSCSNYSMM